MEEDEERVAVDRCENCRFYLSNDYEQDDVTYDSTYGVCRRFPPRRVDGVYSVFPIVEDDWFCGEHQKKFDQTIK